MQETGITGTEIKQLTEEIIQRKNNIALSMLEIGDRLIKAKSILTHGEFTQWLEDQVQFTDRTARNYMRAARAFPEAKRKTFSVLASSQVLLLAELPEESRESFISNHDVSEIAEMSVRELKAAVKQENQNSDILSHFAETLEESYVEHMVPLNSLKEHPDYDRYVRKIVEIRSGSDYIRFLNWMNSEKYYPPIFITKDGIIIDGHERVRAARDLGWTEIKARHMVCIKDCLATGSYDLALRAVFLEWQAWGYSRQSLYYFYFAMYQYTIGNIEEGDRLFKIFVEQGEEIDNKYLERKKEAEAYLEELRKTVESAKENGEGNRNLTEHEKELCRKINDILSPANDGTIAH